ncbi:phosphoenolpyruvate--protein phosphotransferase [Caldisericum sp.]|uniref:phosphoenolpyruvate--protein phosphotransferase n=1 Tax=Caldisericum sp. TaxID=2499687 RepID=UPI003D1051C2
MVGIVIVTHSDDLAKAVCSLALQMSLGKNVPIAPAGGLDDGGFGTSITKIQNALEKVYSDDGVLVLMDLGSAIMTVQMFLEMLPEEKREKIALSNAPLVEGAIAAVVASAQGFKLQEVKNASEKILSVPKLGEEISSKKVVAQAEEVDKTEGNLISIEVVVPNPVGLHARPASLFVQEASKFKSKITIQNISANKPPVDAKSMMEVAFQGTAKKGEKLRITAQGEDAKQAIDTLKKLVESGFGEMDVTSTNVKPLGKPVTESENLVKDAQINAEGSIPYETLELSGIPASPGYVVAPAFLFMEISFDVEKRTIADVEEEINKLDEAVNKAISEIDSIRKKVEENGNKNEAQIFEFHKMILQDKNLIGEIKKKISNEKVNAEYAVKEVFEEWRIKFEKLNDAYMKLRAADIKDIGDRVISILTGKKKQSMSSIKEPVIIVAKDLSPSDTALLEKDKVKGILTALGGSTSHTSILAKMWGIPAVVGAGDQVLSITSGTLVAIDGMNGKVVINPKADLKVEFEKKEEERIENENKVLKHAFEPAITTDGKQVEVVANIGDIPSAYDALKFGAEGIGLLRTEVLYLERQNAPDEDEQYNFYKQIGEIIGKRPLIIRTADIGGDKPLPYLKFPNESNPFLGLRAVRLYFEQPDFFLTQIKAILRAAVGFNFKIMLPMISSVDEVVRVKNLIEQAKDELLKEGKEFNHRVDLGIMVEIPSAAILADKIVEEVDFFSIGSNDLTQYTLAVDRGNESVSSYYQPFSPALFRLFKMVIDAAHTQGKWAGLCGELAGERDAVPVLLGLGLDEFSMSPRSIPSVKALIRSLNYEKTKSFGENVLNAKNEKEVKELIRVFFKDSNID